MNQKSPKIDDEIEDQHSTELEEVVILELRNETESEAPS